MPPHDSAATRPHVFDLRWVANHIPGAEVRLAPLAVVGSVTPSFVIRRWTDWSTEDVGPQAEMPAFGSPQSPWQEDSHQAFTVAKDRWIGQEWFGLRLQQVVRGPRHIPLTRFRWLLWDINRTHGIDIDRDAPDLDIQGSCAIAWTPLVGRSMDGQVFSMAADWRPRVPMPRGPKPGMGPNGAQNPVSDREALAIDVSSGRWCQWASLQLRPVDPGSLAILDAELKDGGLSNSAVNLLRQLDLLSKEPGAAGELSASGRIFTDTMVKTVRRVRLTSTRGDIERDEFSCWLAPRLMAVEIQQVFHQGQDSAGATLLRAEDLPELTLRSVGSPVSDTRALRVDTIPLSTFQQRVRSPSCALPDALEGDPAWAGLWNAPWVVWQLAFTQDGDGENGSGADKLRVLTAGRHGNYILQGVPQRHDLVRLVARPTSELFDDLMRRVVQLPSGTSPGSRA